MVNFHISIHQLTYLKNSVFSEPQERAQFTIPNFKKCTKLQGSNFNQPASSLCGKNKQVCIFWNGALPLTRRHF